MGKKKATGRQDGFAKTCSNTVSGVITAFLVILVFLFPLIYDNSYFNILETKYKCYYMSVIGMLAVLLALALALLVIDMNEFKGQHAARLFSALSPKNWKRTFAAPDVAVLVFWAVCLISTLQSEYVFEAFWGNEGRYSGLFLITLYVAFYFVVSRFFKVKGWILELFLISGMVMCAIGITDYFRMDILHFRVNIKPEQSTAFTSTIGNINTYTAYVAMIMGLAAAMFATAKSAVRSVWYYACMVVAFFAIIMGCSDNAYLALGAMFAFLPLILFRSRRGVVRYTAILATFATTVQCIDVINRVYADKVIGLDSLFNILTKFNGLPVVAAGLWALTAALYFLWLRGRGAENDFGGKGLVMAWLALMIGALAVVCFMVFDANVLGNGERYGSLGRYLVFNDGWGSKRGYIWRKSVELYRGFPLKHKLFGFGPDTFGIMTTEYFRSDMVESTGLIFDNAHNEYLQFLLTIGPIGLAAYLAFLISSCRNMMKRLAANLYIAGCFIAVLCYAFQAIVNLNLPIATPMMWLLLSVGMAAARNPKGEAV